MGKSKKRSLSILVQLARILLGATFVFSGFVKAIDPLGSQYKIEDYLITMGLPSLLGLALPMAIFLVVLEFSVGVMLLLGIFRKWSSGLALLIMLFMTPLTLWVALKNPVKDCGCFGDALVISNWATLCKNVLLLLLSLVSFFCYRYITPLFGRKMEKIAFVFVLLFGLSFSIYGTLKLPIIDFRPYKIGSNIPANMQIDPSKSTVYKNVFIYEKNGEKKEFTEENYPWQDTTWAFVEMKTSIVKQGEKPKIEDFNIQELAYNPLAQKWGETNDLTQTVLNSPGYTFLMIASQLDKTKTNNLSYFQNINKQSTKNNVPFYLLTSSSVEQIKQWSNAHHPLSEFTFCHSDERMLKTMLRSNPGLILLHNGTVVGKWDSYNIPKGKSADKLMAAVAGNTYAYNRPQPIVSVLWVALLFFIPLIIMKFIERKKSLNNNF